MAVRSASSSTNGLSRFLANTRRVGGIAGIIYVVLFVVGVVSQGDTPMLDDDAATVRDFFSNSDDANRYLIFDWLIGMAFVIFFLPFISALRSLLAAGDPSGGMWARLSFIGGLVLLTAGLASSVAWGALAITSPQDLDDSTLLFASRMNAYGFGSAVSLGIVAFLLPASLVILASHVLWRWLGFAGVVLALLNLVGALWVVNGEQESFLGALGIIGFIGYGLWVLATSIGMLMTGKRETA